MTSTPTSSGERVARANGLELCYETFGQVSAPPIVLIMGLGANLVAKLVQKYHWIAWVGLVIILYVALGMIWEGWHQIAPLVGV